MSKLESISNFLDISKKLLINVLLIVLSGMLLFIFINQSRKKQLFIRPFVISSSLAGEGYSGEFLTSKFIDKVKSIQEKGASLYHANNIVLPSWQNKIDEIGTAFNNSAFSEIKSLLIYFGVTNSKYADGQIIKVKGLLNLRLTIGEQIISAFDSSNLDILLTKAAEDFLKYTDPFALASYYLQTELYDSCLQIVQRMLNGDDKSIYGLALHLRGMAYYNLHDTAEAKLIFFQALKSIKTPWLTYNDLGELYRLEYNDDSARIMYDKAIKLKKDAYLIYLSYSKLLLDEFNKSGNQHQLDSSYNYYKKAICLHKDEADIYVKFLPVLFAKKDSSEFKETLKKALEMDPKNVHVILSIGFVLIEERKENEARQYIIKAKELCGSDTAARKYIDTLVANHHSPKNKK